MMKYLLILLFTGLQITVYSQVKLSLEEKEIIVNKSPVTQHLTKIILDSLIGTTSRYTYVLSSYTPSTGEKDKEKRHAYRFTESGIWVEYYAKEKTIYSVTLFMKSSNRNPEKDNLITYPNVYRDGNIIIDSATSMEQILQVLNKQSVLSIGMRPYLPGYKIPSILYKKNDFYIELMFHPATKLIKQIYIIKR